MDSGRIAGPVCIGACLLVSLSCGGDAELGDVGVRVASDKALAVTHGAEHTAGLPPLDTEVVFSTMTSEQVQVGEGASLAARFINDRVWALAQGQEIVLFDTAGKLIDRLGRAGEGPGEYQMILALGVTDEENLLVTDFLTGRLTQLEPSGTVIRIIRYLEPYTDGINGIPLAILADGKLLAVPHQWRPARGPYDGLAIGRYQRDPVPLLVYDSTGRVVDSLGRWPGIERHEGIVVPFARSVLYSNRGSATVIGSTDSLSLSLFRGSTLRLRLTAPRITLGPDQGVRARRDSALIAAMGQLGRGLVERQRTVAGPDHLPAIGGLVLDTRDRIWVGDYLPSGVGPRRWVRYSARGEPEATMMLPGLADPLLPNRSELLDATQRHLLVLIEGEDGELAVELRKIGVSGVER